MGWKDFLKPSKGKIVLFVILYAMAVLLVLSLKGYCPLLPGLCSFLNTTPVLIIRGLIAAVAWYLISCLIVWAYSKFRKKK